MRTLATAKHLGSEVPMLGMMRKHRFFSGYHRVIIRCSHVNLSINDMPILESGTASKEHDGPRLCCGYWLLVTFGFKVFDLYLTASI